jgi:hypothetical protein
LNKCAVAEQVDEVALVHNSTGPTATRIFLFLFPEKSVAWRAVLERRTVVARQAHVTWGAIRVVGAPTELSPVSGNPKKLFPVVAGCGHCE